MPVIKSAIKAMKQSNAARERNRVTKADFRGKVKLVRKDVETSGKDAEKLLASAVQAIDKAAKKGVLHPKAAARRKSRLMLAMNKAIGKPVIAKAVKAKVEKPVAKTPAKKSPAKKATTTRSTGSGSTKKTTTKKEA
jgi:small subunit ribosomal protein S20